MRKGTRDYGPAIEKELSSVPDSFMPEVKTFHRHLKKDQRAESTQFNQLHAVRMLAEWLNEQGISTFADATAEHLETFFADYTTPSGEPLAQSTANIWKTTIRKMYWVFDGSGSGRQKKYPEKVETIRPVTTNNDGLDSEKEPIYRNGPDVVEKLLSVTDHTRDRAFTMLHWDCGLRINETVGIKVGDITFHDGYAEVVVHQKKAPGLPETRRVPFVRAQGYVLDWLGAHPDPDPTQWLWVHITTGGRVKQLRYRGCDYILQNAAKKAGLDELVPHDLRHCRATEAAMNNWSEAKMRRFFGWSKTSKMPSRYSHIAQADVKEQVLTDAGRTAKKKTKPVKLLPKECPRCAYNLLPATAKFCPNCGSPLTQDLAEKAQERLQEMVRRSLVENPASLESLAQEVAKVLKRGYTETGEEDVDGVPGIEEL